MPQHSISVVDLQHDLMRDQPNVSYDWGIYTHNLSDWSRLIKLNLALSWYFKLLCVRASNGTLVACAQTQAEPRIRPTRAGALRTQLMSEVRRCALRRDVYRLNKPSTLHWLFVVWRQNIRMLCSQGWRSMKRYLIFIFRNGAHSPHWKNLWPS